MWWRFGVAPKPALQRAATPKTPALNCPSVGRVVRQRPSCRHQDSQPAPANFTAALATCLCIYA